MAQNATTEYNEPTKVNWVIRKAVQCHYIAWREKGHTRICNTERSFVRLKFFFYVFFIYCVDLMCVAKAKAKARAEANAKAPLK